MRVDGGLSGGFTILEFLVSLVIVASGIMAILTTMTQGMGDLREHNQALLAKSAMRRQMEFVHTLPFAQLAQTAVGPGQWTLAFQDTAPADGIGDGLETITDATGTIDVCDYNPAANPPGCDGSVNTSLRQIIVTVTLANNRSFRVSTLISQ